MKRQAVLQRKTAKRDTGASVEFAEEHENRFYGIWERVNSGNVYHTSVVYLLALNNECYRHIDSLFDFTENLIKPYGACLPLLRGILAALWAVCALGQLHQRPCWCRRYEDCNPDNTAVDTVIVKDGSNVTVPKTVSKIIYTEDEHGKYAVDNV